MTNDEMLEPRYQELATFMRAPYRPDLDGVDIALYGVPYDGGVTNRPGARHGPREIRNQSSLMRTINHATRVNPYERCSVADVGDVRFERVYDNAAVNDDIEQFVRRIVGIGAGAGERRHYDAVGRLDRAIADGLEQGIVRHGIILWFEGMRKTTRGPDRSR